MMKLIFKATTNNLIQITLKNEMDKALEIIMNDSHTYLMQATTLLRQILPGIYPAIHSLHLYTRLRDRSVQEVLTSSRMMAMQKHHIRMQSLIKEIVIH